MASEQTTGSIDEYIARFAPEVQQALGEVRALIRATAPDATETISYGIPTFDLNGKHLVHFAGYQKHIGFYPTPRGIEALEKDLEPYRHGKGTLQFPLDRPLPTDLIRRVVEARVADVAGRGSAPGRSR